MPNVRTIELEIAREKGETYFKFKVDPAITELYKNQAEEIKLSKKWVGLSFFYAPKIINNELYKRILTDYHLFDEYGNDLFYNGGSRLLFNIAWLRTKEGEGQIKITEPVSISELTDLTKRTCDFIKDHFNKYFQDFKISGKVSIELP